ncbi:alpha/beta hydrolase [Cognatishimia sp. WU-CL00825]|uniref:alpha/beta fold hydrolase n=1 Tax=Cognatishimia sp. WU-CL00825 TaxID=3127658 RepID=UPI003105CA4C
MMTSHAAFWRTLGQGPKAALALHCSLAHSGAWKGIAAVLGDKLTLNAVDLPGHGKSPDWDGQGDFTDFAIYIAAAGLAKPADIVAHSFGAYLALRLAAENPEKVQRLALYEPVFFASLQTANPDLYQRNALEMQQAQQRLDHKDPHAAARAFLRVWGDGTPWELLPQEAKDSFARRIHLTCAIQPAVSGDNADLLSKLPNIHVPVLLMVGENSPDYMHAVQQQLVRLLPNAKLVTIPEAAHMGPISHPDAVAREISEHFQLG